MFRQMRRFRQALSQDECQELLRKEPRGVLALHGEDGYPYALPMNQVYLDGKLYFHGAKEGHKLDAIAADDRASFCVTALDSVQPEAFTTHFRSVIAEGKISVVQERDRITAALVMLCGKYSPGLDGSSEIAKSLDRVAILKLDLESAAGKEAIELTRKRQQP